MHFTTTTGVCYDLPPRLRSGRHGGNYAGLQAYLVAWRLAMLFYPFMNAVSGNGQPEKVIPEWELLKILFVR